MPNRHADRRARRGVDFGARNADQQRRHIAYEAARLISEEGLRDYGVAKRKAAARLGIDSDVLLPRNSEIEEALRERQRLFHADDQPQQLRRLREVAREAMRFFNSFSPRLVGAVLDGTADRHSAVALHLFSDDPDAPARFLEEHGIDYTTQARRLRTGANESAEFPVLLFHADETPIDITVFDQDGLRQAPLDRIDGAPMSRATLPMLEQLLTD